MSSWYPFGARGTSARTGRGERCRYNLRQVRPDSHIICRVLAFTSHSLSVQDNDGARAMTLYYDNPDQLKEINSYVDQLRAQDDRSCVIMIAARIESLLESAMDRRLIDPQSGHRTGVMGNLANTIDLCHRLGILHSTHADALHALRRVRNSAAHFDEPMSLDDRLRIVEEFFRPWAGGRAGTQFRSLLV